MSYFGLSKEFHERAFVQLRWITAFCDNRNPDLFQLSEVIFEIAFNRCHVILVFDKLAYFPAGKVAFKARVSQMIVVLMPIGKH